MHLNKADNNQYIVASCKQWHYQGFRDLQSNAPGLWYWAATPEELENLLTQFNPRYIFFLHWNWLVSASIYQQYECVCFHMTDVPYGRGGSPLQNLIMCEHSETKLTALRMIEAMDAGPVYTKKPLGLDGRAQEIYERAGKLSFDIIRWMINEEPEPTEQIGDITIFKRRKPDQSKIPSGCSQQQLYDFIRMLDADGYPHAFIEQENLRFEFRNARKSDRGVTAEVNILFRDSENDE